MWRESHPRRCQHRNNTTFALLTFRSQKARIKKKKSYQDVKHLYRDFSGMHVRETASLDSCPKGTSLCQVSKHSLPSLHLQWALSVCTGTAPWVEQGSSLCSHWPCLKTAPEILPQVHEASAPKVWLCVCHVSVSAISLYTLSSEAL